MELNSSKEFKEFYYKLLNTEWSFVDGFDRIFLTPDVYETLFDELSELRNKRLISVDYRNVFYSVIKTGKLRYKEYLIKRENLPRKEAQKFIGKKNVREFIFKRDNYKCLCCGSKDNLSLDHIISVKSGGKNALSNLQTLCIPCNSRKSNYYKDYRNG